MALSIENIKLLAENIKAYKLLLKKNSEDILVFQRDRSYDHMLDIKLLFLDEIGSEGGWCDDGNLTLDNDFIIDVIYHMNVMHEKRDELSDLYPEFVDLVAISLEKLSNEKHGQIDWYCEERYRTDNYEWFAETYTDEIVTYVFDDLIPEFEKRPDLFKFGNYGALCNENRDYAYLHTLYLTGKDTSKNGVTMPNIVNNVLMDAIYNTVTFQFIRKNIKSATFDW